MTQPFFQQDSVAIIESLKIRRRGRHALGLEHFPNQPAIRASGKLKPRHPVHNAKLGRECFRERPHSGTAGAEQRPVYVEQHESNHVAAGYVPPVPRANESRSRRAGITATARTAGVLFLSGAIG